ncbi:hypothetical protein AB5I41_07970 [Sphingomonas sp. MMS24-JH45]
MAAASLPPLRQELRLDRGAPLASGAPGFVLFIRCATCSSSSDGWNNAWPRTRHRGDPASVRDALVAEGTPPADAEAAVAAFHDFARANGLTSGAPAAELAQRRAATARDGWRWLLDHYLFIRVPLVRPAAFLSRTLPFARAIWSPAGVAVLGFLALAGLFLVTRQWDAFVAQAGELMTPGGVAAYMAALLLVKGCHELGHAWTATRHGVRVPAMGCSACSCWCRSSYHMSAAWLLCSRRQRMQIDAAGGARRTQRRRDRAVRLAVFLPDPPRTIAFILATTSLATSLLVNASPFMRFDGYYLLSDRLRVPNLAPRAFALMRWRLRELLVALGEPAPEPLSPGSRARCSPMRSSPSPIAPCSTSASRSSSITASSRRWASSCSPWRSCPRPPRRRRAFGVARPPARDPRQPPHALDGRDRRRSGGGGVPAARPLHLAARGDDADRRPAARRGRSGAGRPHPRARR